MKMPAMRRPIPTVSPTLKPIISAVLSLEECSPAAKTEVDLMGKPKMSWLLLTALLIKVLAAELLKLPFVGVTVPLTIVDPSTTLSIVTASVLVLFSPRMPKRVATNLSIFGRKIAGVVSRVKAN